MPTFNVHFACQGGGDQPLKICLRRITETKTIEIPQELLTPIIEASYEADSRREIMRHLRECLSEPTGKRWHRIYAALLLVEKLMQRGSHALVIELAHGHHFDLIQKVSLLEHFDSEARGVSNPWAQDMVRKKAGELRAFLVPLLERASEEDLPVGAGLHGRESLSTCSPAMSTSTATESTAASSSGWSASPVLGMPKKSGILAKMRRYKDGGQMVKSPEVLAAMPPKERLQSELSRITESGIIDMPPEFFTYVVQVSGEPESQHAIMQHIRGCLADPSRTRWQRVFAALCLVDSLSEKGPPQALTEGAQSGSFNLVRQIWHLQEFEYRPDWRAQNLIRKKARKCHDALVTRDAGKAVQARGAPAHENIGDAFSTLRAWVEAVDLGAQSERSSPPSSNISLGDLEDEDGLGDLPFQARRGVSGDSQLSAEEAPEAFFTPMQTPAQARATPRPGQLLSL